MRTGLGIRSPPSWTARSRNDVPALLPRPSPPLNLARGFRAPNPGSAAARALRPLMARRPGRGDGRDEEEMENSRGQLVRTLLIDNYDSYTYNIYQELSVVNGVPPVVVHNDEWTWDYIYHCLYEERAFDNIVISPGPGTPTCPKDVGICLQILLECKDMPILGVCLGHQALGLVHGAQIVHAPEPVHGRLSEIEHSGCNLFRDIPSGRNSGFKVVRYHSLVIDAGSLPKELIPIAWTASLHTQSLFEIRESDLMLGAFGTGTNKLQSIDPFADNLKSTGLVGPSSFSDLESMKILMGIMHCSRPHYGVQFHPESVATCLGRQIFKNFKKMTVDYGLRSSQFHARKVSHACQSSKGLPKRKLFDNKAARHQLVICGNQKLPQKNMDGMHMRLQWKRFDGLLSQIGGAANIFCELFGDKNAKDTFWLDSSSTDQGKARFSFLGGKGGPLWKQITFELSDQSKLTAIGGRVSIKDVHGSVTTTFLREGFLEFLNKELESFHYDEEDYEELPFDFCGGFIGFIGYNLKVECGASSNCHKSTTPDACFFFADNLVVIDHSNGDVYILSIKEISHADTQGAVQENLEEKSWLVETEKRLLSLKSTARKKLNMRKPRAGSPIPCKASFVVEKPRHQYIRDVEKCLKFIRDGESYELCLTTQMRKRADGVNPLDIYLNLRDQNPAPYAAWLNFDRENLSICCSSPERFLRLDGSGILEAKPIKGTIARGRTPEEDEHLRLQLQYSEKDQAENLMIVDLLRNDLGRVCEPGSVHVPRLMEVESYATVHTMVSTIQGKRRPNVSPIDCVRAAFPGGSMTGAPKLRSVELLDSLESSSRGVYSGCIGFFSYNQTFDLNIVIRTVVIHKGEASVGAGGAIVALSNPEVEYEEMMLKAKAPTKVVEECSREFDHRSVTFKMATQ